MLSAQVALSVWSDSSAWSNYRTLVNNFQETKNDSMQDKTKRCTHEGLQTKITTTNFILYLRFHV
jgi:hypothetical protein